MKSNHASAAKRNALHAPRHPHVVPTLRVEEFEGNDTLPEIGPDLRYRLVSEAAYHRFLDRGCVDGYDVDDRLTAEADVERELQAARVSVEP